MVQDHPRRLIASWSQFSCAKKEYVCCLCDEKIHPGSDFTRLVWVNWKNHLEVEYRHENPGCYPEELIDRWGVGG
jgi:hypothetical protein